MIKRIQIKNFKCYGDPGVDFTLKRVNFIFGDNSAGKSTFLQLIRMIFNGETESIDREFSKYVFRGETSRNIKMRVTALGRKDQREGDFVASQTYAISKEDPFHDSLGDSATVINSCPVWQYEKTIDKVSPLDCIGVFFPANGEDGSGKLTRDSNEWPTARQLIREYIPHVIHVEASRPERLGDFTVKSSLSDDVMLGSGAVEYVNSFFRSLNVPYTCVSRTMLRDNDFGVVIPRRNVGAGIDGLYETALKLYEWRNYREVSCVSTLGAQRISGHALLALEEPESHVNERQVSPLMNFLFEEAKEGANGQIVVECHSELMALKLKNFVRSGLISPDDLAIHFAEKTPDGTIMHEIVMDEKGNYKTKWPNGGFFTERTKVVDEFFKAKQAR